MYAAMWYFGMTSVMRAVSVVGFLSLMFPITYFVASRIPVGGVRYLFKAELLYGALYGGALVYALGV